MIAVSTMPSPPRPEMEARTQTRYERSFKGEINKLEAALAADRETKAALEAQLEAARKAELDRRAYEAEKTQRLKAMEQAIAYAEKQSLKTFAKQVSCRVFALRSSPVRMIMGR